MVSLCVGSCAPCRRLRPPLPSTTANQRTELSCATLGLSAAAEVGGKDSGGPVTSPCVNGLTLCRVLCSVPTPQAAFAEYDCKSEDGAFLRHLGAQRGSRGGRKRQRRASNLTLRQWSHSVSGPVLRADASGRLCRVRLQIRGRSFPAPPWGSARQQ